MPGKAAARQAARWLTLAWVLHYVPFFAMGRVLYFHHYLPAFSCSAMLAGVVIEYFAACAARAFGRPAVRWYVCGAAVLAVAAGHAVFGCLSSGMAWPLRCYAHLKWMSSWEFA